MLLFYILFAGCYTFRTSVGLESKDQQTHVYISEHLRFSHIGGQTLQLGLAPGHDTLIQHFALNAEISLMALTTLTLPMLHKKIDFDFKHPKKLEQFLMLSSIGTGLFHYQYDAQSGSKYGLFTPFV